MKKTSIVAALLITLFSCTVDKRLMTTTEQQNWSSKRDTIYHLTTPIAVYDHSEYELNPRHGRRSAITLEISIKQISYSVQNENLVRYIHTIHPKDKVELVLLNNSKK